METDILIQMGIMFFCIALLTFWFKKRWKKKPEEKISSWSKNEVRGKWKKLKDGSDDEDRIGGKWTAEQHEPEPPERSSGPEAEPPERSSGPEPEPPERSSGPEAEPPERSSGPEAEPPEKESKE